MARNSYRGRKRGTTVLAPSGLHYSGLPSPNFEAAMRAFNCANVSGQLAQEPAESVQQPSSSRDLSSEKSVNPSQNFNHARKRQHSQRQFIQPSESSQKRICDNTQPNNNYYQTPHDKSPIEVGEPSQCHLLHEPRYITPVVTRSPRSHGTTYNMQQQPEGTILLAYQPQMANTNGVMNLNYSSSPVYHPNNIQMAIQPPANIPSHHNLTYKDLKMGDFITQLCTRENVTVENVTDSFFRELVSMLLEFMDIFPGIKQKIHALLCPLIDFGIMHSTRDKTYSSVSTQNANVETSDRRINNISTLLQIDKKIDTLMRQKLNIYPELLKSTRFDVADIATEDMSDNDQRDESDNRLNDIIPDSANPNDTISNNNVTSNEVDSPNNPVTTPAVSENLLTVENIKQEVPETKGTTKFYPQSQVEQLCKEQTQMLKVIKMELLGHYQHETDDQNDNLSENRQPTSPVDRAMEQADPHDENKTNDPNLFASNPGSTDEIGTTLLNFQLPEIRSTILCMNIVQETCIVGCDNGCLMLFSLANGHLQDSVYPSTMSIVSITLYQNKIITASKDSVLKSYNTSTKKIKSTSVNYPISCTHDNNGRLYVGTASGHMVVLNLKSLAILCQPTQISSTPVTCITMFKTEDIIAVVCEGKPVMLRNSSTGALLQSIKPLFSKSPFITSLVFTDDFSKMICSRRNKLLEYVPSTGLVKKKSVGMKISLLQQYKSLIIVGGDNDDCGIINFYSKDGKEVGSIKTLPGKPIALYVYLDSSIFISTNKLMLTHIFLPNEVKFYLEDHNKLLDRI